MTKVRPLDHFYGENFSRSENYGASHEGKEPNAHPYNAGTPRLLMTVFFFKASDSAIVFSKDFLGPTAEKWPNVRQRVGRLLSSTRERHAKGMVGRC